MTRLRSNIGWTALVFACLVAPSQAQKIEVPDWENSVRFELVTSQEPVRPSDEIELAVVAEIDQGYHLYGPKEKKPNRTEITVSAELLAAKDPIFPAAITRDLAGLGKYNLYEGRIAIRIPVSVSPLATGQDEIPVDVRVNYQVCTDFACSAPTHTNLSLRLPVAEMGAAVRTSHGEVFDKKK